MRDADRLAEIQARTNAAAEGPWYVEAHQPTLTRRVVSDDHMLDANLGYLGNRNQEDAAFIANARSDVPFLLDLARQQQAEIAELQAKFATSERQAAELANELAEEKAAHNPRLRCLIVKAAPDRDMYIGWSNNCEMPAGVWSRETALEYGFPPSRLDRADATGTSSHIGDGAWDDKGFVAEQRGWLKRDRLGDYAVEYLYGDRIAAYALLEPFEGETEVRR